MKLLTQAHYAQLLDNGRRQAAVKGTPDELDFYSVVKLFDPCGAGTWLLTEVEPDDPDIAWGLCDLGMGFPFGVILRPRLKARIWFSERGRNVFDDIAVCSLLRDRILALRDCVRAVRKRCEADPMVREKPVRFCGGDRGGKVCDP